MKNNLPSEGRDRKVVQSIVIRFAGDSGDGMQLAGTRFTIESAIAGNYVSTLPDFPAEIRAPAGTLGGVSSFQIHLSQQSTLTAGDELDVLVAFNPAAYKKNIDDLKQNGLLICDVDAFSMRNLKKAGFDSNPLDDPATESKYNLLKVPITTLTHLALEDLDLKKKEAERSRNFFALGLICHLFGRGITETKEWLQRRFGKGSLIERANRKALEAGQAFVENSEAAISLYSVPKGKLKPGRYRNITGNEAIALALIAASIKAKVPLFYAGYPITPASDILHILARYRDYGAVTFQAEDEMAACCAAIGASYGGALGATASSGPGIMLKQEAISLAVMAELPLVVIDSQRAGPSTGMPTKNEQGDLFLAVMGRSGESPVVVLAPSSPSDAFPTVFEGCRIALEHMVPVVILSDGYIGNGSEPFLIPSSESLGEISPPFLGDISGKFEPYARNPETLARQWVVPGTKGGEHRIGGLEKQDVTGSVSYDPENHERMVFLRAEKVNRIRPKLDPLIIDGKPLGSFGVISWGSAYGAVSEGIGLLREEGYEITHIHLRMLNPLPDELASLLKAFDNIIVAELNSGQLAFVLQGRYSIKASRLNKIQGQPFSAFEVKERLMEMVSDKGV